VSSLGSVNLVHVLDQIDDTVAVSILVIIPVNRQSFNEIYLLINSTVKSPMFVKHLFLMSFVDMLN